MKITSVPGVIGYKTKKNLEEGIEEVYLQVNAMVFDFEKHMPMVESKLQGMGINTAKIHVEEYEPVTPVRLLKQGIENLQGVLGCFIYRSSEFYGEYDDYTHIVQINVEEDKYDMKDIQGEMYRLGTQMGKGMKMLVKITKFKL